MTRVVVIGAGAAGEAFVAAFRRVDRDAPVTVVERELIGGECSYWACMPSKTLLRSAEALAAARLAPGAAEAATGRLAAERAFWWRDRVAGRDDSSQEEWLRSLGVEVVRGTARVARPGAVEVDGRELPYEQLVVASGSAPAVPALRGLDPATFWTSRDATTASEVPEHLVVLGGGVVACELAQFYRRAGAAVTVVVRGERLLGREDEAVAELLREVLEEEGVSVVTDAAVAEVRGGPEVALENGRVVAGSHLLVATGRRPNVDGLGLEQLGVRLSRRGVEVDESLRAADDVFAVGDVTGVALFTHVGKYQGRVAAENAAGGDARADYRAVPRVTFTDPQIASVGTTGGDGAVAAEWRVDATARASTYERPKRRGFLKLFADPEREVLVGAVAVGPEAGEWLQQVTLAIRAEVPVTVLRDTIQPYPTFSEAVYFAARELPL